MVKFKEQNQDVIFYHKVLRKTVKIVEKSLKGLKVLIEKCAADAG
jgi:hypothetical protein